ncbi:MAG: hypothetical protein R6X02_31265 [Enhygromyxa sp.]
MKSIRLNIRARRFDGDTSLTPSARVIYNPATDSHDVVEQGGGSLARLGALSMRELVARGIIAAADHVYVSAAGHSGQAGVRSFVVRSCHVGLGRRISTSPTRETDPTAGVGQVGPFALGPTDELVLSSDAAGEQVVTLELMIGTAVEVERLFDRERDAELAARTVAAHAASHQLGGADRIDVTGLPGVLADEQNPTSHAISHQSGGGDAIKLDDLAAPDDTTDLNASTSAHGLLPKLSGDGTEYLAGDGSWSVPSYGPAESLTDTLVAGNVTGGENIELTTGDSIVGEAGGSVSFDVNGYLTLTGVGNSVQIRSNDFRPVGSVYNGHPSYRWIRVYSNAVDTPLVNAADASGSSAGTSLAVRGGTGGSTSGAGGSVTVRGGHAQASNSDGGSATISGGDPSGTGTPGIVTIAGASAQSGNVAGAAVSVAGGAGKGTGAGGALNLTSGGAESTGGAGNIVLASGAVGSGDLGVVRISNTCLEIGEAAFVPGPTVSAGFGRFWVENVSPNKPKFTDDAGSSFTLATTDDVATTSLSDVLLAGNTTGGADIEITMGDSINGETGGSINFDGSGDVEISPTSKVVVSGDLDVSGDVSVSGPGFFAGADGSIAHSVADDLVVGNGVSSRGVSVVSGSTSSGYLFFARSGASVAGGVTYSHNSNTLSLYAGGGSRVRVDSDGLHPGANNLRDLGSTSRRWRMMFAHSLDLVESASAPGDALSAGYGRLWVRNDKTAMFTDANARDVELSRMQPIGGGVGDSHSSSSVPVAYDETTGLAPAILYINNFKMEAHWWVQIPHNYDGGDLVMRLAWTGSTSSINICGFSVRFDRCAPGRDRSSVQGVDTDFHTPGPAVAEEELGPTQVFANADMDGIEPGDLVRVSITRAGTDDYTGNAYLFGWQLY